MSVSLILPCYNPPPGWNDIIRASYDEFCRLSNENIELVVVLDGKGINNYEQATDTLSTGIKNFKVVSYTENKGKGYAIRQGAAIATGDIILYTDVDFPYTTQSMLSVLSGLRDNIYDVGIGVKNDAYYAHVPFLRRIISRFLRFLIKVFLSMPVTDTQCGLKGFNRSVLPLFLKTTINRYLFDLEFIRNCYKAKNLRVQPIPVALNENIHFRKMDYRILLPEMYNFVRLLFKK